MQQDQTANEAQTNWPKPAVAWFGVGVLVLAFVFSIADRIIISLLVDPIKEDLGLTDTDMGLMMGLAFAIFYALMGLPIGRWADRYSRRTIIGVGIFLWSIMTALCGLARSFWELFLARVGVGVGEATLSPAAYSMIADYFPKEKLGRALGVYQSGAFFGVGLALMFGGLAIRFAATADDVSLPLVGVIAPWQLAFIVVGLPGVLVAAMMFLVLEPPRQGIAANAEQISLGQAVGFAWTRKRVFLAHYTGFALLALPMTTLATWVPAYFMRVVGMSPPETGLQLGLIVFICAPRRCNLRRLAGRYAVPSRSGGCAAARRSHGGRVNDTAEYLRHHDQGSDPGAGDCRAVRIRRQHFDGPRAYRAAAGHTEPLAGPRFPRPGCCS